MTPPTQVRWTGWSRWTAFLVAALLIALAVPLVTANSPAAGWDIFLALLLFGAVASGSVHAPTVALALAGLFLLRALLALASGDDLLPSAADAAFALALGMAGLDLRRQRIS